ncbi:hypothetical protein G6F46_004641 [Rhizopus delemar]|uniref:HAD phosphatase, family IIIA n=2 Tax=Rhizopus TaxID=4842 RepID=A0A9P7CR28_9FUNG|nr:hypothetical protein G6F43_002649 [Rhizopus delemar]KAG1549451.1 hypothetical protein G6F51_003051 [Rhizopus arrhizus]KAG1461850.1 hypothetical protein G6F55_003324 [Rhizopus delemar]KAG1500096.1 hypothetical protein G6F54_003949 [Rhizopus delemar]KAG1513813.1 hypothetical protein G6F53_004150 [Rhizopus delemar]
MVQSLNVSGILNAFRVLWNPSLAMPHVIVKDMSCINYAKLKKQCDIQAIAFDKDNCLTAPYVSTIHSPFNDAWKECKETFGRDRAQQLESSLGVAVLRHKEKKPDGGQYLSNFVKPIPPEKVAFVGDRIFTDILFGNRNGNLTIWTSQIITEEGDNKPALLLRRMEHHLINILQKFSIKAPSHPALNGTVDDSFIITKGKY